MLLHYQITIVLNTTQTNQAKPFHQNLKGSKEPRFACYLTNHYHEQGAVLPSFPSSGMAYVETMLWGFDPIETHEHQ